MNTPDAREQARHKASVMIAFAEGKEIESSEKGLDVFELNRDPSWDWWDYDYRVKPEERKPIGITVEYNGIDAPFVSSWDGEIMFGITHFVEVLPETETES